VIHLQKGSDKFMYDTQRAKEKVTADMDLDD